jgi:hypothetical protein
LGIGVFVKKKKKKDSASFKKKSCCSQNKPGQRQLVASWGNKQQNGPKRKIGGQKVVPLLFKKG